MTECNKCFHFKVCKKAENVENYKLQGECGEFAPDLQEALENIVWYNCHYEWLESFAEKLDSEIHKYIVGVAKEQGLSGVVVLDKEVIAEKLKRLEPAEIVMEESLVSSCVHYYCPVCGARIGKYPFCKYCGQAIDWSELR